MEEYIDFLVSLNNKITIKPDKYNWKIIINNNIIVLYEYQDDKTICKEISNDILIKILKENNDIKIKYSLYYNDDKNDVIINKINNIKKILNNEDIIIKCKICYN